MRLRVHSGSSACRNVGITRYKWADDGQRSLSRLLKQHKVLTHQFSAQRIYVIDQLRRLFIVALLTSLSLWTSSLSEYFMKAHAFLQCVNMLLCVTRGAVATADVAWRVHSHKTTVTGLHMGKFARRFSPCGGDWHVVRESKRLPEPRGCRLSGKEWAGQRHTRREARLQA